MTASISAVILAGGAASRLKGTMKPNLLIGDATIFARMLRVLKDIFDDIIVVTNNPPEFKQYGNIRIAGDQFHKAGPLAGIHSGMKASDREAVFVFAGDMPFLNKKLIIKQIELFLSGRPAVLVPRVNENTEPLHSIYSNTLLLKLEEYLKSGKSPAVRDFLVLAGISYFDLEDTAEIRHSFMNINDPSDITGAEDILLGGSV